MFKILNGHTQGVPCFLACEDQAFMCKVIDNMVLIEYFSEHYIEFFWSHLTVMIVMVSVFLA